MRLNFRILSLALLAVSNIAQAKQVAIIIDDIGYHQRDLAAISLPGEISYSILPHTPFAKAFAIEAHLANKETLLHVPMQALSGKKLGPGGLTEQMSKRQVQETLEKALNELPQVKGINNHMGSFLTQKLEPMIWTMEILKQKNLYFLDSKTTDKSLAQNIANLHGVNNVARHVFLDNIPTETQMNYRLNQLIRIAKKREFAIAIAHPYPETLEFLQRAIVVLQENEIELVPLSQLVQKKYIKLAASDRKKSAE